MHDSAIIYYKKVFEIDPKDPGALMGIGTYYFFSNKPDSSYIFFKKGLESGANSCWDYMKMGEQLLNYNNDVIEALRYFQKAYDTGEEEPPNLSLWYFYFTYLRIGDFQKASRYLYKTFLFPRDNMR